MDRQQSLFEDLIPESPANEAAPRRAGLKILPAKGQTLGKAQKTFNRLVARVEHLRKRLAAQTARLDAALADYSAKIHPLKKQETALRKEAVRLLFPFLKNRVKPPFGKRQRTALRGLLSGNLEAIAKAEGGLADADLQEVFSAVEGMSMGEAKKQALSEVRENLEEVFSRAGMDVDLSGMSANMSEEEAMRMQHELFEKMQEAQARLEENGPVGENGRPRKKTKKQLAAEQREQALEEARQRGIGSIYKQLARVFHPDLEQDAERRAEKEELMKELTVAHKAGDLHTLLRLELEWIQREESDAARLTDEKLEIYNAVLKEQIQELERDGCELAMHPRYEVLRSFSGSFSDPEHFDVTREVTRIERILASLGKSIARLRGDNALLEVKAILQHWLESRDEDDFAREIRELDRLINSISRDMCR
jgi:transposase